MAFEKGNKLATGRPQGSLSKRSQAFLDTLHAAGINPVEVLLSALKNAFDQYETCNPEHKATWNAQIIQIGEKMLPYVFPKLSAIEVTDSSDFAHLTVHEKLEKLKKAIPILEMQKEKDKTAGE